MSNSCEKQAKATASTKMAKISGSSKNYEAPDEAAKKMCSGGSIGLGSGKSPYSKD